MFETNDPSISPFFTKNKKLCKCEPGYFGISCANKTNQRTGIYLHTLSTYQQQHQHSPYNYVMYGASMEYYKDKLYIFGNGDLTNDENIFIAYDLTTNMWETVLDAQAARKPENRFMHCSFVYQVWFMHINQS